MELFYAYEVDGGIARLDAEESGHCVRVLRHRAGDGISVIDGLGSMFRCRLSDDNPKGAVAEVLETFPGWGSHPYHLTLACCPTKNNDRFEWFVEKATEIGVDRIVPTIGERSERKVYKTDRAARIALSATKQSLKARIPVIDEPLSVRAFIDSLSFRPNEVSGEISAPLKLIAYCFEDDTHPRISIKDALSTASFHGLSASSFHGLSASSFHGLSVESVPQIIVLIGPEGDFSPEEARHAIDAGFIPVHLGTSRLRTETAAVTAAEAVYFHFL